MQVTFVQRQAQVSAHYLFRGIVAQVVAANRDLALTAEQVTVAVIAAPSAFRRWLAAQISRFNAAHTESADLVFFPQRHFAGRSRAAEGDG
ncbi:MAG: hypothetical protein ACLQBK_21565 [Candidatus Sulfotelmatobacter sp.]